MFFSRVASISTAGATRPRRRGPPGCPRTGRCPRRSTRPPSRSGWCAPASWCPRCSTPAAVEVGPVPAGQLVAAVLDPAAVEALQVMAAVLDPAAVEALQVPADGPVAAVLDPAAVEVRAGARRPAGGRGARPGRRGVEVGLVPADGPVPAVPGRPPSR